MKDTSLFVAATLLLTFALTGCSTTHHTVSTRPLPQRTALKPAAKDGLTNLDLIRMQQAGLGDKVIIESIRLRGGRFHLSPDALISLKDAGISDDVISEIQSTANPADETTVVSGTSTHVVVVARPALRVRPIVHRPVVVRRPGPRGIRLVHRR